ncbi:hypothetical protein X915_gp125 [Bacillus phage vB_BanS-Tsamsa]|uniref:Uncharacterized protein n=1 Tax=Bacillus phage vB_BanS-Tsamsa TaxID=1308863 RepID=U5J9K3_9CAUD|nr:hypothetical protein X915_gp125 [Bacillus phage vB_BanS-Tsamsa]AGI11982.1 hypothetical protein [Bacillus phage vB_BanS-Tsamsa]
MAESCDCRLIAKIYVCNHCQLITEPITYTPTCKCGREMIEGTDE